jgi:chromosome segregation ATPase
MTNYLEFLIDLWKITKEDGGFKAFSALISKHGVNKSISVVLCDDLEWVSDEGSLYMWQGKKPTKKDAETVYLMIKTRLEKQKKDKAKRDAAGIGKPGKETKVVYSSSTTKKMVDELAELGKAISNVNNNTGEIYTDKNKFPYDDVELNKDVKEILKITAEEVALSKRLYDLQEDYAKSQLQLETERKISFDEIDRLNAANQALENQIVNLTNINGELRDKLVNVESRLEAVDTENSQLKNHLNSLHTQLEERNESLRKTTKSLEEANKQIQSTIKYKIQSWFRK